MMNSLRSILRVLLLLIKYKPGLFVCNAVFCILLFTYNTVPIYITREVLDSISGHNNTGINVFWLLVILLAVSFIRVVVILVDGWTHNLNMFLVTNLLKRNIMEIILKKPDTASVSGYSGVMLNSFKEDAGNCIAPLEDILDIVGTTAYTIAAIVFLLYINPAVTLFVFLPLAFVILIIRKSADRIGTYREKNRTVTANISEVIGDIAGSVLTIKVSGAQKHIVRHFEELNRVRGKAVMKDIGFTAWLNALTDSTVFFGTAFILLFVAGAIKSGSFTVGDFSVFVYYLTSVADYIQRIGRLLSSLKQSEISLERICRLLGLKTGTEIAAHQPVYAKDEITEEFPENNKQLCILNKLEIRNVSYRYPQSRNGIDDISFSVAKGAFVAIAGRTGAGKTTLLETLIGILPAASGAVFWNGGKIEEPQVVFTPPHAAYAAQRPLLFSGTIRENILLGLSEEADKLNKALRLAVFEDEILKFPQGLDTVVGSGGAKLSGGQAQRVAVARALLREPELLVLDDISSALDVETESALWKRLAGERNVRKFACLVVSNKNIVLQQADHILVLKDGRIESQGSYKQLIENCGEFRKILQYA